MDENTEDNGMEVAAIPLTRDQIRAALLGKTPEAKVVSITAFGITMDLRQPRFGDIMDAREEPNPAKRAADLIAQYACVPGTNELIFEDSDIEMMLRWPFGEELVELQNAIAKLTGLDITGAEDEIKADPLKEPS